MATGDAILKFKRGNTTGVAPTGLTYGEPAVNLADVKLWVGAKDGTSTLFFAGPSGERPQGSDGQLQYIYGGGFSASNNLAFIDGTTLGVTGDLRTTGWIKGGAGASTSQNSTRILQGKFNVDGEVTK